jgi:RNA polymerase sigma-70 factor (ECF subfamily)
MSGSDAGEFARVYGLHALAVHATACRILGNVPAAEDVVQEVFLELWRRPEAYDPARGALRSWLCTVARNKAIDQVRRAERQAAAMAVLAEVGLSEDAAEPVMRKALADSVWHAIEALPATHRAAIVLAYYQGFTYRQVALTLSIPEGTAKSRLRLGLRRLNRLLAPIASPPSSPGLRRSPHPGG